jgi:SPP1 gp7 family putative phage head morphogenesis protein
MINPITYEQVAKTERDLFSESLLKKLRIAISRVFAEAAGYPLQADLIAAVKKVLCEADKEIYTLAIELALANSKDVLGVGVVKETVSKAVGEYGTIKQMTSTTTTKMLDNLAKEYQHLKRQRVPVDEIRQNINGTSEQNYTDGLIKKFERSKTTTLNSADKMAQISTNSVEFQKDPDIIGYMWDAKLDSRTCTSCMALDNKKFYFNRSGRKYYPQLHLNCRCTTIPIYPSGDPRNPDDNQSFNEWADDPKNQEALKKALGPTRYKLFKDGKLRIERFNSVRYEPLTLEQLKKDANIAFSKAGL